MKRLWLGLVLFLAGITAFQTGLTVAMASGEAGTDKRPNVLFLFSDDQRFDTVGALGNSCIKTPNLDRLAERGFVFRQAYCFGSTSPAVCLPSRAMVHTGRSLWNIPKNPKGLATRRTWAEQRKAFSLDGIKTWAETMREGGYSTFGTGKWHNGKGSYARGFTHGGAIFFGGMSNHLKVPIFDFDPSGEYPDKNKKKGDKFSSELFADAAISFLNTRAADKDTKPFFMYVSFSAPHDPRMAPKEYVDMYDAEKLPLADNIMPRHPFDNGELKIRDERLAPWPRTPKIVRRQLADYYAMITHMDHHIGRILDALEKSGRAENTIIVFSSDHGLSVGRHGLMGKQNLYEHAMRPPLFITGPGISQGESQALVYLHDLFPTVCELVRLKTPAGVEGKSIAPIMRGQTPKVRDYVIGAYRNFQRMVREPQWKLITYDVKGVKTRQLFDLENDPCEMHNLIDSPQHQKHVERLQKLLDRALRDANDPKAAN